MKKSMKLNPIVLSIIILVAGIAVLTTSCTPSQQSLSTALPPVKPSTHAPTLPSTTPPPPLPVIVSFAANPTSVNTGGCSTLSWSVSGATSVTISPGIASGMLEGSTSVCPSATTNYILTATTATGSVNRTVTITVAAPPPPPVIYSFIANPASVYSGICSSLTWNVSGATSLVVSPDVGSVPATSSAQVCPAATTTYTLTATNVTGSVTRTATVRVMTPPTPPVTTPTPAPVVTPPVTPPKTTTPADSIAPIISMLRVRDGANSGAVISWVTSELSSTQVEYGVWPYANTTTLIENDPRTGINSGVLVHEVGLTNLIPRTSYVYRAVSYDKDGNKGVSPDMQFDTALQSTTPPTITNVEITAKAIKEVGIVWKTDQLSSSQVEWGPKGSFGNKTEIQDDPVSGSTMGVSDHGVIVKGLTGNTEYQFRVISRNKDGIEAISDTNNFTTPSE